MKTKDQNVDAFLEHFGIKGMRWGVRKAVETNTQRSPEENTTRKSSQKKAAVILGSIATAAAISAGALYLKKHGGIKVSSISKTSETAKNFADTMAKEPISIMHSSRGRDRGYMVLRTGGLKSPDVEFINAGLHEAGHGYFKKYGEASQKLAVAFNDPEGRKDFAGRTILHQVIFPAKTGKHLYNFDQAREEAWPLVKDIAGALYEGKRGALGPGF